MCNHHVIGLPEERKEKVDRKIFKEIKIPKLSKSFPNLVKTINPQIQEDQ